MKLICDRAALLNAVNLVSGAVAARSPKVQLTCVRLTARKPEGKGSKSPGAITLSATDGEVALRLTRTQVEVQDGGELLIPGDRLRAIVSAEDAEPTLTLESEQDVCHIRGRDAKFKVFGYPAADFPPAPDFPRDDAGADVFTVKAETLARLIGRTLFSTARETSRYAINGVLLKRSGKKIEMVATDGRRLALARGLAETASSTGEAESSCIIASKALGLLARLLSDAEAQVRVAITANQIIFAIDDDAGDATVLAGNLVEGTFPPYEDVIPKDQDKRARFDVHVLSSAVRRAALLTNEDSRGVRLSFTDAKGGSKLKLSSRAPEMGESEIDVEMEGYEGEAIDIGFNPTFIVDALKVVPEEQVILEMKAPNKPGLIKSGSDFLYVVMPVNLQ
ncbi:MAG TPA: DNA polymerase III subunit beta [Phycisphaerales bacterium]|nr:DNA polymerase III subunit beta [Phycisphaerales bacterium]